MAVIQLHFIILFVHIYHNNKCTSCWS